MNIWPFVGTWCSHCTHVMSTSVTNGPEVRGASLSKAYEGLCFSKVIGWWQQMALLHSIKGVPLMHDWILKVSHCSGHA